MNIMPPEGLADFAPITQGGAAMTGASVQVCGADPSRVALILFGSVGTSTLAPIGGAVTAGGMPVGPTLPPVILTWADHGPLVNSAWFGTGAGVNSVGFFAVRYTPRL